MEALDKLLGHCAKGDWAEMMMFPIFPFIGDLEVIREYAARHELSLDEKTLKFLALKCQNLKMSQQ